MQPTRRVRRGERHHFHGSPSGGGEPGEFLISGWAVLTGDEGDELHETFSGQLNLATGVARATITYVPQGTGRFANATGTATLELQLAPNGRSLTAVKERSIISAKRQDK